MRSRRTLALAVAFLTLLLFRNAALAATDDHLDCVRIKDPLKSKAVVDLITTRYGEEKNCKVRVKSTMLCAPATKSLIDSTAPSVAYEGETLTNSKLCYKVKCGKVDHPDPTVFDQFGLRPIRDLRPRLVCTPASVF